MTRIHQGRPRKRQPDDLVDRTPQALATAAHLLRWLTAQDDDMDPVDAMLVCGSAATMLCWRMADGERVGALENFLHLMQQLRKMLDLMDDPEVRSRMSN